MIAPTLNELMIDTSNATTSPRGRIYIQRIPGTNFILCCYSTINDADHERVKHVGWGALRRKAQSVQRILQSSLMKLNANHQNNHNSMISEGNTK